MEQVLADGGEPRALNAERPTPQPRTAATPPARKAAQPDNAPPQESSIAALIERLQKTRPLVGSYLAAAKSSRREGDRLTFVFTDSFYADSVSDAKKAIEEIATELFGSPVSVNIEVDKPQAAKRSADSRPATLRDDPVVQSFAKHLGGEIVESRRSK